MKIKHIAHACFVIENSSEKLIIDPYDNSIGYSPVKEAVNYILISHNHYDHNYIDNIELKDNVGSFNIKEVHSYHDKKEGNLRGENTIHIIETEGIKICHLGDLGHILTDEQLKYIKNIDILLIPVGGTYTIDYMEAIEIIKQIKPKTVIPMHYKTGNGNLDIDTVDNFIKEIEKSYNIIYTNTNEINYIKTNENKVYII